MTLMYTRIHVHNIICMHCLRIYIRRHTILVIVYDIIQLYLISFQSYGIMSDHTHTILIYTVPD